MNAKTPILSLVAAVAGFAFLASPAQAGVRHHHRHHNNQQGYSYYNNYNGYYQGGRQVYYRNYGYPDYRTGPYYYYQPNYYRPAGVQIGITIGR